MNTIEFIGPPGVGKSSIYKRLCKKWHPNQHWTYPEALLGGQKPPIARLRNWIEFSARQILHKKIHYTFPESGGLHYIQEKEELANFYWKHFHNYDFPANKDISFRFRAIFYLYRDFCKHQAIQNAATDKLCILDEGFLQKSFLIHEDVEVMQNFLDEYLALLPLPRAIFWVDIDDVEVISNRIRHRQKIVASHIGKDNKDLIKDAIRWQQLAKIIAGKMDNYRVRVFKINGEMPIEDNVVRIQKTIFDFWSRDLI